MTKGKMTAYLLMILFFGLVACSGSKKLQVSADENFLQTIQQSFESDAAQYKLMMKNLPAGRFPRSYDPKKGKFETSDYRWWCIGFYPGTLLYLYEQTKDQQLYDEAMRTLKMVEDYVDDTTAHDHDLGFVTFCSFGNAERIASNPGYKEILLKSARSLSKRFNPAVGCIKSWNSKSSQEFLVIIDNMMNLELLFWASKISGDPSFRNIAITHADNTLKNHFRPDYSSYHVINYNPKTGVVQQKKTAQGYSDSSAWARGQAWALYGYTLMYRETKEQTYLDQAEAIASFILDHPNLPADKIPYWDFDIPNALSALRDASAAAITSSALLELCRYTDAASGKKYLAAAEAMLLSLSSPRYHSAPGANGGFLLQHSVGHHPAGTEVDVSLTYADYYFTEAKIRYKDFKK